MTVEEGDEGINGGEPPFGEHGVSTVAVADILQPLAHVVAVRRAACQQGAGSHEQEDIGSRFPRHGSGFYSSCKGTNKRAENKRKYEVFNFAFPSASTFDEVRGMNK
jgi:hypothetical protein